MSHSEALRIDKWLWYGRFFKSRSIASRFIAKRRVRVNNRRINKSSQLLKIGDILTFSIEAKLFIIRVVGLGSRRGPRKEANMLYMDITPSAHLCNKIKITQSPLKVRRAGLGRPTKRDRRAIDYFTKQGCGVDF